VLFLPTKTSRAFADQYLYWEIKTWVLCYPFCSKCHSTLINNSFNSSLCDILLWYMYHPISFYLENSSEQLHVKLHNVITCASSPLSPRLMSKIWLQRFVMCHGWYHNCKNCSLGVHV
jgi:hypothetical protein